MSNSYKNMAKSSGLIAFVQVFQMVFGLIRNKGISLIVGTTGFGIWSLYHTFIEMLSSFSVFGLDQGGVREVARTSDSKENVAKTIYTFRLIILLLSVIFGTLVFLFAVQISEYLFGTDRFKAGVQFLSLTVVFNGIARGGYAILNGVRALRYLAVSQIIAAILGSLGSIALVFAGGERLLPHALSIVIFTLAVITTIYVRKLKIRAIRPTREEFRLIAKQLIYMGLGFTVAGVVSTVMTLLSRGYLSNHYSLGAVGIYQASWTIANLYVGILLNAMGIDFMPRLSKVSDDNNKMNEMINQQIDFAVSFGSIGISLVIVFAPVIIYLLYSADFVAGATIARWQILGVAMRILAFPFSYSIMAKAKPVQYAVIQIVFWTGDYLLLMLFSSISGFDALGINCFVAYMGYLFMTFSACRHNHSFSFSPQIAKVLIRSFAFIAVFWLLSFFVKGYMLYLVALPLWLVQVYYVDKHLRQAMDINMMHILSTVYRKIRKK